MDFVATTASSGAKVTEVDEVERLIKRYRFPEMTVGVDSGGNFFLYGYDWFVAYDKDDEHYEEELTEEFLEELKGFIKPGETLIIQSVGYEGCMFPLAAWQGIVTNESITHIAPVWPEDRILALSQITGILELFEGRLGRVEAEAARFKKLLKEEVEAGGVLANL